MILTITDETFTGEVIHKQEIEFETEVVTVQEIIEKRVIQEVEKYNSKAHDKFKGLVEPTQTEKTLNARQPKQRKLVDSEKQVYVALDAFKKNGFFVLVDNLQVDSLEQQVQLKAQTIVSFVKLTPLIGG
ncbi:hypothetical protein [Carboxylicivirga sp. RSCT41]|uniref:hypothetical protein n=1 Tax=Carboxylicivirga agarovorans TaxID=3417570 RepID=UPI003D33088A